MVEAKEQSSSDHTISWAFVTPSYSGDYRRCSLLCRSMDHFVSGNWTHYIVVDRPDYQQFHHLENSRRSVLLTDEVLQGNMKLLFHMPFLGGRSVWWSKSAGLSIGWHLQQMVKIGISDRVSEDGLAYCDSDTVFLKPFDVASLSKDGKFRLFRSIDKYTTTTSHNPGFLSSALPMFDLPADREYHGYVDNFVTWRRKTALEMSKQLSAKHQGDWRRAFRNRLQISEYTIYGLFADEVWKGEDAHFRSNVSLCKTAWLKDQLPKEGIAKFCSDLAPFQVMVGIQSFTGVDISLLETEFERAKRQGNV